MKVIITEKQFSEISRILEIMDSKKEILSESKIGRDLLEKIWKDFSNSWKIWKIDYPQYTDRDWQLVINFLKNGKIHRLTPKTQKQIAEIIKRKKQDYIPEIYSSVIENWLQENPNQNYKGLIQILKYGVDGSGNKVDELLSGIGVPDGKPIIQDVDGNADYFSIDLIAPRIEKEISNLNKGKDFEFSVATPKGIGVKERLAQKWDKKMWSKKYPSLKSFYEGMLRSEPGSKYFFTRMGERMKNLVSKKGTPPLDSLSPEEKQIMNRWFVTGVADWPMVRRIQKAYGWPHAGMNVLGQLARKWMILTGIFYAYNLAIEVIKAAPDDAEEMSAFDAVIKRVLLPLVKSLASLGLVSPLVRIVHFVLFAIVLPAIKGRSKYEILDYLEGRVGVISEAMNALKKGKDVQDPDLEKVEKNPEILPMKVKGTPMPNTTDTSKQLPTFKDTLTKTSSSDTSKIATIPDEEDEEF